MQAPSISSATGSAIHRYRRPAIALHWLIAALIFGGYGLGLFMTGLPVSADKLRYFSWHKWIGVTVFLLALLRVLWRATHTPPPLPAAPRWEHWTAHGTHALLYLLMFAIPLSGWLHSSAAGYQTVYLGLIPLPDLLAKNEPFSDALGLAHLWLNYTLLALLVMHAGAALQHHYLRRDVILRRMLPMHGVPIWAAVIGVVAAAAFGGIGALLLSGEDKTVAATSAQSPASAVTTSGEVTAEFRQMTVAVTGRFTAFHAEALAFDPEHLDAAIADIVVDTASFNIGDAEYNDEVRKPEWLDAIAHPQARFRAQSVTRAGAGFEAIGELTLKGRTQAVTVPFTVTATDQQTVYAGTLSLSRKEWAIGDESWNDVLEDTVVVRFTLTAPVSKGV